MTDEEREIMGRHAGHWQPFIDSGQMVIFGPVFDSTGSWGLGVIEAEDEEELRALAAGDPAVTTGTAKIEPSAGLLRAGRARLAGLGTQQDGSGRERDSGARIVQRPL
jgi:uncharacterized protein YciI